MNDVELARRAEGGDLAAFTVLYQRYYRLAFNTACKLTRSREASEDVASDIFLKLAEGKWRLDPERTPQGDASGFVKCLAHFGAITYVYRRPIDNNAVENFDDDRSIYNRLSSPLPNPEKVLLQKEVRRRIHDAIAALPPQYRRVAIARYYGELTCPEIAAICGVQPTTIPSYLAAIRAKLRKALAGYARVPGKGTRQARGGYIRMDDQSARYQARQQEIV